jgi:hypothetical protein
VTDKGTFRAYGEQANLRKSTLDWIHAANHILAEFEAKGHSMTLRQLYYQFVARGFTDGVNNKSMYERLGTAMNTGRMHGLVSWTALEDRDRNLRGHQTYVNTSQCIAEARDAFKLDLWADQQWRPEVWIEKSALVNVIGSICSRLRVDFFATKGYNSQSEQWRAGQRFARYVRKGQRPIVFHLGDHDPSGIDMTRDNQERLSTFAGVPIIVQRLALNMKQVEEFNPPPNYAKETDSRTEWYVEQFGEQCWELDALDPVYIENLIKDSVLRVRDEELWNAALAQEVADLAELDLMIEQLGGGKDDD